MSPEGDAAPLDPGDYCRRIEAYLCRANGGHLVRIVGPSFERVAGWAQLGIPLKVTFQGIDRACDRYHQKGRRLRPMHIDFCEADVLEAYGAWRRAVGASIAATMGERGRGEAATIRRGPSLAAHLDRAVIRLSSFLAAEATPAELRDLVEQVVRELGALRGGARGLRGEARRRVVDRLAELDRQLGDRAIGSAPPSLVEEARAAAREQLAPLRDRMAEAAHNEALRRISEREIRARLRLPTLAFD